MILTKKAETMKIIEYDSKYRDDFVRLNTERLTKLYYIESYDQYAMDHVEELIEKGSMVYFAIEDEKVLATCMIEPLGDGVWELCKLAAEGQYTGTGHTEKSVCSFLPVFKAHGSKSNGIPQAVPTG